MLRTLQLSGEKKITHTPRIVKIKQESIETISIKSLYFDDELSAKSQPGQYLMVWIPGIDEIPMSISFMSGETESAVTVRNVGSATNELYSMKNNQQIGVRGPYGKGFNIDNIKNALIVAGGSGGVPLGPLSDLLKKEKIKFTCIIGAPVAGELLFLERHQLNTQAVGGRVLPITDDGSYGTIGLASEMAETEIKKEEYDMIYTCGPEPMIKKIVDLALENSIPVQASLERIIKCGIGICGSCVLDSLRVCKDGPVFDGETIKDLKEFNVSKRDASGKSVPI
ncbi:dihydroorotate dehydrogenase electron transfer subunit [Candidatus Bathyarchaeota archaeon RBG_13_38_9]|nr:MAG: dihydroorotate dehydrogenase electron transfer subunit [Candidatus Bathyarchaeota archaeon RBG_13_38_9]